MSEQEKSSGKEKAHRGEDLRQAGVDEKSSPKSALNKEGKKGI